MNQQNVFHMGHVVAGIFSIFIIFLGNIIIPNIIDCNNADKGLVERCKSDLNQMGVAAFFIGMFGIIMVLIAFFRSIKPLSQREQIEKELDELRGSTHGTLPKGFSTFSQERNQEK